MKKKGDKLTVSLAAHTAEGKTQDITDVTCLLWAVGRDANMVELGIESTKVQLNNKGFVKVDEYQNTTAENIYALGDIAGNKLLTPGKECNRSTIILHSGLLGYEAMYFLFC